MKKLPKARLIFLLLWVSVRVVFHMAGHDWWASFISVTSAAPCSINYDNLYSLALFWAPFLSISSFTSSLSPVLLLSPIFPQLQVCLSFLIFHHLPLCVPARQAGVCTDTYTAALSYFKSTWERTEKLMDSAVCAFTRRGASFSGDLFRLCAKRCHHQGNGSLFAAMHACKKINE